MHPNIFPICMYTVDTPWLKQPKHVQRYVRTCECFPKSGETGSIFVFTNCMDGCELFFSYVCRRDRPTPRNAFGQLTIIHVYFFLALAWTIFTELLY